MSARLLHSVRETSAMFGISHWTVRKHIHDGKIRPTRIGRRVMVSQDEIERILAEGRASSNEQTQSAH